LDNEHPISNAYWVVSGQFAAGAYPYSAHSECAREKLRLLLEHGISAFFDLTERDELEPYSNVLTHEAGNFGIVTMYQKWPLGDMTTPSPKLMVEVLDAIDASIKAGKGVYLHCAAGLGRTGVVVGCYLVRHGMSGGEALEEISCLRRRDVPGATSLSPETVSQRNMVRNWGI
jgi:protein-tyrosine phosphatase